MILRALLIALLLLSSAVPAAAQRTFPIVCTNWTAITLASTTSLKIIALKANTKTYICSINLQVAGANNVALISGTKVTTDCDTGTVGLAGGTTAASGWNLAANGSVNLGVGSGVVAQAGTGLDVCLLASANTQVSGVVSWVQF